MRAEQLPELVHLLGELLTAPRFDPEELVRERSVILEEIAQSEDQPDDWVSELFYGGFWEGTPLAHPILGRPEQVAEYGAREARAFFDHTYRAPNLVVAAAGDSAEGPFLELLQPILDRLPKAPAHAPEVLAQSRPFLRTVRRTDLQHSGNTVCIFAHHSQSWADQWCRADLSHHTDELITNDLVRYPQGEALPPLTPQQIRRPA